MPQQKPQETTKMLKNDISIKDLEKGLANFDFDIDDMIKNVKYKIKPSSQHLELVEEFRLYIKESERWHQKGYAMASARARKHLKRIRELIKTRRIEMLAIDAERREKEHAILNDKEFQDAIKKRLQQ